MTGIAVGDVSVERARSLLCGGVSGLMLSSRRTASGYDSKDSSRGRAGVLTGDVWVAKVLLGTTQRTRVEVELAS